MNIAFFIPSLSNRGGVEISTINIINSLASNCQINLSLIVFDDSYFVANLDPNINVVSLNINNYKKQYLTVLIRLRLSIIKYDVEILITVESMSYLFSFFPLMALRNRPKVVVWEHFNYRNDNGRKSRRFLRILAAKTADLIILLTERDVEEWKKNIRYKAKITYIYNISTFNAVNYNYNMNSKTIIAIGRFTQVKGFDRLIAIWKIFQDKYDSLDWELHIIGYGEDKEHLYNIIKKSEAKNIDIISSEKVELNYADASFYCMTSYFEGLPMVLIEAQSFALPCIAFDIFTGPSEILDDSTGILVEDKNLEAYADAIYQLISNNELREKMSLNAYNAKDRYSKQVIAERWFQELKSMM
ncbi:glycosyltransferase family 4 protein [Psychrobacter sp. BF1]|uniref:glycosyltransferase family 4 protein n=1 Tax=Psychrobacter sp. BF1 TaxID=2821147 RepID=UPI001C4DF723|nr:glycosyltransferase family 4 protein [Psychrobacter sp. BF1]